MPGGQGAWKDAAHPVLLDDFFITKYSPTEFPYSSTDTRRTLAALSNYMNDEAVLEATK